MSASPSSIEFPMRSSHVPAWARRTPRPLLGQVFPLLLAVTDDELADVAMLVTSALAKRKGAVPTVIQAIGPDREANAAIVPFIGAVLEESLSPEFRSVRREALQRRLASVVGSVPWRVEVDPGSAIETVTKLARHTQPGLIVMGLRRRGMVGRAISRDLLRSVVRSTRLPVLAVRPELTELPRRIVVAIDFGDASIHAARMARQLLADDGEMWLVHVATDHASIPDAFSQQDSVRPSGSIRDRLDQLAEDLAPAPGMSIVSEQVVGDAALCIRGCAERMNADLIAVGSDRHSPLERLLAGSVSMALASAARCSMLIVPAR